MLVLPTHVVLQLQLLPLLQRLRYTHVAPDQLAEKPINRSTVDLNTAAIFYVCNTFIEVTEQVVP